MRTVHLHGHLSDLYGPAHRLDVPNVAAAVRACCYLFPNFKRTLAEGNYQIVRGTEILGEENLSDVMHLNMGMAVRDIHIVPVPVGAKSDGLGKILIGTLILATAFFAAPVAAGAGLLGPLGSSVSLGSTAFLGVSFGQIAAVGGLIALTGISQLVSPTPKVRDYNQREKADQRGSFLINSRVNTIEEGLTIPLIYGRTRVGSAVVSAGISSEAALTTGQITTTGGWVSNLKLYRWKSVGTGPTLATSAYSVQFTNAIGDASLPNEFEDVTFYGYHAKLEPKSGGTIGVKPIAYLQSSSLSYFGFTTTIPMASELDSMGFPYEDQQKTQNGTLSWEQQRPITTGDYPGLNSPSHATPWQYTPMWNPASGSLTVNGHRVLSAMEYVDGNTDPYFQLVLSPQIQTGLTLPTAGRISPTEDHFTTVTVQADDADRTTIYELQQTDATSEVLYDGSRVWRWALGATGIDDITAPASATDNKFFWVRLEKESVVTVTHTIQAGRFDDVLWVFDPAVENIKDVYGHLEKVGDNEVVQLGPLFNPDALGGNGYVSVWDFENSLPLRENDYIVFFGGPAPSTWALIVNTPGRAVDWFDSVEIRHFDDNALSVVLNTADVTHHVDNFAFKDGTTGTMWLWEYAGTGQPEGNPGSMITGGAKKMVIKYHDRTAPVN